MALDSAQISRLDAALSAILLKRELRPLVRYSSRIGNLVARAFAAWLVLYVSDQVMGRASVITDTYPAFNAFPLTVLVVGTLALVSMPVLSPIIDARRDDRLLTVALATASTWGGPRCVGALARATKLHYGGLGARALPALRSVLSRLDSTHYGLVSPEAIRSLCELVQGGVFGGFTYLQSSIPLVLETLGKVAGGSAIATVESMASSAPLPLWREQAKTILPILRERKRLEQDSARLLRATESPESSESLLRPVGDSTQPAELLVRPSNSTV